MTEPSTRDPSGTTRRALREAQSARGAAEVVGVVDGTDTQTRSGRRRAMMIGSLTALGLGAVALAQNLVSGPTPSAANTASGSPRSARTGAAPLMTPSPRATPTPKPRSTPPRAHTDAVDRDSSYADVMSQQSPATRGHDPELPAATATEPLDLPVADSAVARRHLLRRATLSSGAAAEAEVERAGVGAWLARQLDPNVRDSAEERIRGWFPLAYADIATSRSSLEKYSWDGMFQTGQAALARAMFSDRQIFEQVADVFANLLHVTTPSDGVWDNGSDYHLNVIRAHSYGSFRDMLLASARHPAMLTYLDNISSMHGDINENYGRELLELHTVGIAGGYGENEVRDSARILSGRRVDRDSGQFSYEPEHHVRGAVSVLGFTDGNTDPARGLELGDRFLSHLATRPATAHTVARKLAVRFVADAPTTALVERLAQTYLDNDTELLPVLHALFRSSEFWSSSGGKVRRPLEDLVGTVRAAGLTAEACSREAVENMYWRVRGLGQAPLAWSSPDGYPDVASAWMSASQLVSRWNFHRAMVNGWLTDLRPSPAFLEAITPAEGTSVDSWIDAVHRVALGGKPTAELRAASYDFLDLASGETTSREHVALAPHYAALLFHSPAFAIR
ncbi:DUF1800 family protein [Microbacterium sp.]|uniref:DUF1800 domain-containing protein n=1 Tax=Microbacterium sp. TaxID=51671 RepID=UPI003A8544F2